MEQVGRRVAELQIALASRDDIVDFARNRSLPRMSRSGRKHCLRARGGRSMIGTSSIGIGGE
jgi:hypothetical protein